MTRTVVEHPLYFSAGDSASYGVHHGPAAGGDGLGILFCSPFGWDDISSYTSRRTWAATLAAEGHDVLRFDLPGTGDSAGSPQQPGRLDAWCTAVADGVGWLRGEAGCARVALVGLGLGGLPACAALDRGLVIEDLVLWGVAANGRAAVRQLKAFARLQTDRMDDGASALPEGWLEVGGYVLSASTLADLSALEPAGLTAPGLERALLPDADGTPPPPGLAERLTAAGVEVRCPPGPGFAAMVAHPETSRLPVEAVRTVSAWLAEAPAPASPPRPHPAPAGAASLLVEDGRVRETPVTVPGAAEALQGILAEPAGGAAAGVGAVLFNAGTLRRTGPNRLWVETARAWAALGVPTLRFDLGGIGDSGRLDGDPAGLLYTPGHHADAQAALTWLLDRDDVERAVVVGLCSGGHHAFDVAASDARVSTAVAVNTTALHWDGPPKVLDFHPDPVPCWPSGGTPRARLTGLARWAHVTWRRERAFRRTRSAIERRLTRLRGTGTHVVLALCEHEPEQLRLDRPRSQARLRRWPNVVRAVLPGADHTLRPVPAQRAVRRLLDDVVRRELASER